MTGHGGGHAWADAVLLDAVQELWTAVDPPPADLVERCLVAIGMDDLELELLLLEHDTSELVGARGVESTRTLTFSGESVSVMVTITPSRDRHFRLDGWVAPLGGGRVQARSSLGRHVDADVDHEGRFVLLDVPAGIVQLVYHPRHSAPLHPLAVPPQRAVEEQPSPRSVAAPPVRL